MRARLIAPFPIVLAWLFLAPAWAAATDPCANTQAGEVCPCDVRTLRPMQGAIGMEEVRDKVQKITAKPGKESQDLAKDPIKVVRGPGGALFITDHHHGADAWRLAGHPVVVCLLGPKRDTATEAGFWSGLAADRLTRLADANGRAITPGQLPPDLARMPDDPYRSLAWRLRKAGGFCRADMQKEFAEFTWADWLRTRAELPPDAVAKSSAQMLPAALALARSPAARAVPGFVGDKPPGAGCASDG